VNFCFTKGFWLKAAMAVPLVLTVLFSGANIARCESTIIVEGKEIEVSSLDSGDYVSLNKMAKKLGLSVKYFPDSKMYKVIGKDKREIRFVVDKRAVVVGDTFLRSNNPVTQQDDDVIIPLDIVSGIYSLSTVKKEKPANDQELSESAKKETPDLKNSNPDAGLAVEKPAEKPVEKPSGKAAEAEGEEILSEEDTGETAVIADESSAESHEATIENIKYRRNPNSFELDVAFDKSAPKSVKYVTGMEGKNVDIVINKVDSKLGEQLIKVTENIVDSVKLTMVNQENSNRVILSLSSNAKVKVGLKENGNILTFVVDKIEEGSDLKPLIAEDGRMATASVALEKPVAATLENIVKKTPTSEELKGGGQIEVKLPDMDELISGLGGLDYIIAIDAGHGGEEFGVVSEGRTKEKEVNFDIARRLKVILDKTKLRGILVRNGDYFMPLENRLKVVNTYDTKILVSLHAGGANSSDASGVGVYYYDMGGASGDGSANAGGSKSASANVIDSEVNEIMMSLNLSKKVKESKDLAEKIAESFRKRKDFKLRNVKSANFSFLSDCTMPSVIIETGFLTNREDEKSLLSDEYKDKLAAAIFEGIKTFMLANKSK